MKKKKCQHKRYDLNEHFTCPGCEEFIINDYKAKILCYLCSEPLNGACTVDDDKVRHAECSKPMQNSANLCKEVNQAIDAIKAKLKRNDNIVLKPGLIYALTILELKCPKSMQNKENLCKDNCEASSQSQEKGLNPLKQRVYRRLESMKLKDVADKINELVDKLKNH